MLKPATERQVQVLVWIAKYVEKNGYQPSIREIGSRFRIVSPNGVVCHLKALEKKGYIRMNKQTARAIKFDWRKWATHYEKGS